MKLFLAVGTHAQFNRLVKKFDELVLKKSFSFQIFAQIGKSDYEPTNFSFKRFLTDKEFNEKIDWADVVVCHSGAGTILNSFVKEKKVIVVPRLKKFKEHTDNHQLDLAIALQREKKVLAVFKMSELEMVLNQIKLFEPDLTSSKQPLINALNQFLGGSE